MQADKKLLEADEANAASAFFKSKKYALVFNFWAGGLAGGLIAYFHPVSLAQPWNLVFHFVLFVGVFLLLRLLNNFMIAKTRLPHKVYNLVAGLKTK